MNIRLHKQLKLISFSSAKSHIRRKLESIYRSYHRLSDIPSLQKFTRRRFVGTECLSFIDIYDNFHILAAPVGLIAWRRLPAIRRYIYYVIVGISILDFMRMETGFTWRCCFTFRSFAYIISYGS